jgi:serine/threonine protein kinase/tetratricopeptide (TPR) repeat protein
VEVQSPEAHVGAGRFSGHRRLGAGGMGVVYEVHDAELDVRVAIKELPRIDADRLLRFKQEFRTLSSILHPTLVELYELISDGDRWFFTMELVDGVDFLDWVRPGGALDESRLRATLRQLVIGVGAVHSAARLHRDLKRSNVMVRPDGRVAILDFGLATELGNDIVGAPRGEGTVIYMAPEQWTGETLSPASDWYAVGVMLYEALTGRPPFTGRNSEILMAKLSSEPSPPSAIAPGTPTDLDQLCAMLLRRNPAERPDVAEILRRLGHDAGEVDLATPRFDEIPLLGREHHLAALDGAFSAVNSGETTSVHLYGASGSGKSALLSHFLESLGDKTPVVMLAGRCYEQESVPYKALDALVDALAHYLEQLPAAVAAPLVPPNVAALARIFPTMLRVPLVASAPQDSLLIPDQREVRRLAFVALRELLARIGRRQPLVLVIDDLQWGDVDSALLLGELLQPPDPPQLLLLLSYRSEYLTRSACLSTLKQVEVIADGMRRVDVTVDPLPTADAERLAALLLDRGSSGDRAAWIARESGGNPYFIGELARFVRQSRPETTAEHATRALNLDEVLWNRVERLSEDPRDLLEVVAVAGRPIQLRRVRQSLRATHRLQHSVGVLRADHFVRSSGPRVTDDIETYHDRVRESVVAHLDPPRLRSRHESLALAFAADAETADPETLAVHFEGALRHAQAGHYYVVAARAAAGALAFDRAAHLFRRALELVPANDARRKLLHRELADALANAGRGAEAGPAYESASEGTSGDELVDLQRLAATQYCISGRIAEGRNIFRQILRRIGIPMPESPVRIIASLLIRRSWLRMRGVRYRERAESDVDPVALQRIDLMWAVATALSVPDALGVASMQTKGLLLSLEAGEPYRLARALSFEAFLTSAAGWPAARRTAQLYAKAEALTQRIDNPHATGMLQLSAGLIALNQCRFVEAAAHCEEAEEIFRTRCTGVWWEVATARTVSVWTLFHRGACDELRRRTVAYIAEARDRGDLYTVTNLGAVALPHLSLVGDDPERAKGEVDEAIAAWGMEGFHLQHVEAMFSHAHIHLYRGQGQAALDHMDRLWPRLRNALQLQTQLVRIMMVDLRTRCVLAAAHEARDPAPLIRRAGRYTRQLEREHVHMADLFAHFLRAGIARLRGDTTEAVKNLRATLTEFSAHEDRLREGVARLVLSRHVQGEEAASLAARAGEIFSGERVRNPEGWVALYSPGFAQRAPAS